MPGQEVQFYAALRQCRENGDPFFLTPEDPVGWDLETDPLAVIYPAGYGGDLHIITRFRVEISQAVYLMKEDARDTNYARAYAFLGDPVDLNSGTYVTVGIFSKYPSFDIWEPDEDAWD